jgi:hypothetical protein
VSVSRCPGHLRHWYGVDGAVGVFRPECTRCGAPRPRPLSEEERAVFDSAVKQGWAKPEGWARKDDDAEGA